MPPKKKLLRSAGPIELYDVHLAFPAVEKFDVTKLPLLKTVIGHVLHQVESINLSYKQAIIVTAETLHKHWVNINVYPVSTRVVKKRLTKHIDEYRRLVHRAKDRRNAQYYEDVKSFIDIGNKLFEIQVKDDAAKLTMETVHDVDMLNSDWDFLEEMKGNKKAYAEKKVDKNYHKEKEQKREKLLKRTKRQSLDLSVITESQVKLCRICDPS